jgi:diguanylate cyclase (GGDEF)-like protein
MWNSITGLRWLIVLGMLAAFLTALTVLFNVVYRYYDPDRPQGPDSIQRDLEIRSNAIVNALHISRRQIEAIASNPVIRDMLIANDASRIQQWTAHTQQFVPDILRMALVTVHGTIIGKADMQQISKACIADLHKRINGETVYWPVIHRDVSEHEHFDIIVPVIADNAQTVGYVLASYHLQTLHRWLQLYTHQNEALLLRDQQGNIIASSGAPPVDASHFTIPLGSTQLTLTLMKHALDTGTFNLQLALYSIVFFVLMVIIPLLVLHRFWLLIKHDLNQVLATLGSINKSTAALQPHAASLIESRKIIHKINLLMQKLATRQQQLATEARHDVLTDLPNRRYLEQYMKHLCSMVERGVGFRLAIVDIDNFKQINDKFGHEAGDRILKLFAECINAVVRTADFAARYAGDEFVLLFIEIAPTKKSLLALQRLTTLFETRQRERNILHGTVITVSIGTTRVSPGTTPVAAEILRQADSALYDAKSIGRDRIIEYDAML